MRAAATETNLHARFLERASARPDMLALTGRVQVSIAELAAVAGTMQVAARGLTRVVCPVEPTLDLLASFIGIGAGGATAIVPDAGWREERRAAVLAAIPGAGEVRGPTPAGRAEPAVVDDPKRPFYVGFTSGTTGRPKAFARSHRSWIETMRAAESAFGLRSSMPVLIAAPVSLSLGLWAACQALWLGAPVVLPSALTPHGVAERIRASRPAVVIGVPTLLVAAARLLVRGGSAVSVECVLCAGQRIGAAGEEIVRAAFPRAAAYDFYGASELSFVSARRLGDPAPSNSVGRPLPGVEVAIGAPGRGTAVEEGEIWVRSPMLFDGYLDGGVLVDRPEPDGWASVGDVGRMVDGHLVLEGRGEQMVVVSGVNVYVEEVEATLGEHPGVGAVCVVGRPDPVRGARLVAVVERDGASISGRTLRAWLGERLRPEARPRDFSFVEEMPRTASGKPDRAAASALVGRP